jgi:hypothetical protein
VEGSETPEQLDLEDQASAASQCACCTLLLEACDLTFALSPQDQIDCMLEQQGGSF